MGRRNGGDEETSSQRSGTSGADSASQTSSHSSKLKYLRHDSHKGVSEREEGDLLESRRSVQDGVFTCMYTLVRQSAMNSWKFATLKVVMEFLMFFIVAFNSTYPPWEIDTQNPIWKIIRWTVWRLPIISDYGYDTYIVVLYVMVATVFLAIVGLVWLTLAMRRQEQSKWLRRAALCLHVLYDVMFFICYVSFFDYFVYVADCDFLGPVKKHLQFEGVMCLEMPHLLHLLVGLFAALAFLLVTALMVVASSDLNPVSRGYMASPAVYPRLKILLAKAVFVISAADLDSNYKIQALLNAACVALICFWDFQSLPFYRTQINLVWCGQWLGVLYVTVILNILVFSSNTSYDYLRFYTDIVLYGIFPVIAGGIALCGVRAWWVMHPAKKFRNVDPSVKLAKVHNFATVDEVGMLARVMRVFDDEGVVDPAAASWGETIIRAGMQVFPDTPWLFILYANYLLEVKKDGPASRTQLQLASRHSPSLVERYQIFCTGEASKRLKDSQDCGMDLQAYIEFRRNFRAVLRVHKEVLLLQNELWVLMLRSSLRVADVDKLLDALEARTTTAHQVYKRVLERYPTNGKLLRCYGKFLEDVQHDPIAATRAYAEATRNGGGDAGMSLDLSRVQGAADKPEFLSSMSIEDDAVIVINARGQIMMVSQAVQSVFGYPKSELEGANVNVLMPQPFCQRHDGYLEHYVGGGEAHILDSVREVIGLHKERYVFPMALCVTRMSGVGEDSIFLGVCRPLPPNSLNVRAWLAPNGVFMCGDQQFASMCGILEGELVGRTLASMVSDPASHVERLLERCREATATDLMAGTIQEQLLLKHRYMDPAPVAVTVSLAGTDGERILVLSCRLLDNDDRNILVVDSHMRIRFASASTAAMLGFPVRKLMAMKLDALLPPPFNAMHARYLREPTSQASATSCRSGRVVHLLHESGVSVPVRLKISTPTTTDLALTSYVVQVTKVSSQELINEKRLVVTSNFGGKVLSVSQPESDLLGFRSGDLVGCSLCDTIDIFQEWRDRAGESQMQLLMLALLDKEHEMPGTSWRVRVHPPASDNVPNLPPIAGAKPAAPGARKPAATSKSACLQVELHEGGSDGGALGPEGVEAEGNGEATPDVGIATTENHIRVTLWRRDLLTGVVELDEELIIRKASPLTGLIVGMPATAMLRKPIQRFLDVPLDTSWEKLAESHTRRKLKGGLKAPTGRGVISPPMAFIGPHPDTGTMRILIQGVQVLAPGGRSKVTLTMHPDTAFAGAHADLMRVLHLDAAMRQEQQQGRREHEEQAAEQSGAVAAQDEDGGEQRGTGSDSNDNSGQDSGDGAADGDGGDKGGCRRRRRKAGRDDEESGGRDLEAEGQAKLLSRAASKSDFVAQWVRTLTKKRSGQQQVPPGDQEGRPTSSVGAAAGGGGKDGDPAAAAAFPSQLLALPAPPGSPPRTSGGLQTNASPLAAIPEDGPPDNGTAASAAAAAAAADDAGADADADAGEEAAPTAAELKHQKTKRMIARGMSYDKSEQKSAYGSREGSRALSTPPEGHQRGKGAGDSCRGPLSEVGGPALEAIHASANKWEKGSEAEDSSADGSQATSGISGATGATSMMDLVVDTRRGRLLKALQKLLMGPLLMRPLEQLRVHTYLLLMFVLLCHIICYVIVLNEIKDEDHEVYLVQRQALAMDRSQLITVRCMMGAFCERANVTAKVSVCANSLKYTLDKLDENINLMESHHQFVYLGDSVKTAIRLMPEVFSLWTKPWLQYHTYMDTSPPHVNTEIGGIWQLGSRFIAAAREAQYWLPVLRDEYKLHRTFQFLVTNGLGPLYTGYAHSLDLLVDSAWNSVDKLRVTIIVLLVAEALFIQLSCLIYEGFMVQRLESARLVGVLAMLGLPAPVLRQLASKEAKVLGDGADDSEDGDSSDGEDDQQRGHQQQRLENSKAGADAKLALTDGGKAGKQPGGGGGAKEKEVRHLDSAEGAEGERPQSGQEGDANGEGPAVKLLAPASHADADAPERVQPGPEKEFFSDGDGGEDKRPGRPVQSPPRGRRSSGVSKDGTKTKKKTKTRFFGVRGKTINGKVLVPSFNSLTKFMLPFALWNIAMVIVYIVSLLQLQVMQGPLASLNMASHVIYRYTRVRAIAFGFVSQDDVRSRDLWRDMLSNELRLFESEYDALMYGGTPITQANAVFNHPVPPSTFASSSFSNEFFRAKRCFRYDTSQCFKPGDEYYEVTHNGLDVMVRRTLAEMRLLSQDADEDVAYNGTRYMFMSQVAGRDLYEGLQQAAELFVHYSISKYHQVANLHTILLIATIGLVFLYIVFILLPHLARRKNDALRQSALLSHVPPEFDVRGHVRAVAKRAMTGNKKRSSQTGAAVAPGRILDAAQ